MRTITSMPVKAKEWTELDKELMRTICEKWDSMRIRPSIRSVAREIGVTHPRVTALRNFEWSPPTVDEYCDLCELFDLDPAQTLTNALRKTRPNGRAS